MTRRVLAGGALIGVLVIGMVLSMLGAVTGHQNASRWAEHSSMVRQLSALAEREVVDLETGLRGFEVTQDRTFLEPYDRAAGALPGLLSRLEGLVADNATQTGRARSIRAAVDAYLNRYAKPFVRQGRLPQDPALVAFTAQGKRLVDRMRAQFDTFNSAEYRLGSIRIARAAATDRALERLLGAAAISILLSLLVFVLLLTRTVTLPVRRCATALQRLAAGERGLRLPGGGRAEIGLLISSFNRAATELCEREQELSALSARLQSVLDHSPSAVYMRDLDERFVFANRRTAELLGCASREMLGQSLGALLPRDVADELEARDRQVLSSGEALRTEDVVPDGRPGDGTRTLLTVRFPVRNAGREIIGVGGVALDITDRVATELALTEAEEQLRVTVAHAPIGVALVDLSADCRGRLLSVNGALAALLGPASEAPGVNLSAFLHPQDAEQLRSDLRLLSTDPMARVQLELRCLKAGGELSWVELHAASMPSAEGSPRRAVVHLIDIEERRQFQGQLQHLADHDPLTGLFNRRRFEEELDRAAAHAKRYDNRGAVLIVDLDGFKYVNDSYGHALGDDLLVQVGRLLTEHLRATDVVARIGGDEFAVILVDADAAEALTVSEKLLGVLTEQALLHVNDRIARLTASIGATTFGADSRLDAQTLLSQADVAMYEAKEGGKNRVCIFDPTSTAQTGIFAEHAWLDRLKIVVAERRFALMAQPINGICGNGVRRYELLLRMREQGGELIPPGVFLPLAERHDLIQEIDRWVFGEAVRLLALHAAAGIDISLSVNMSGKTLVDPDILSDIAAVLAATPIPANRLVVEVTETAAIVNIERARAVADGLRELGCQFALDDFGAGFASFYYLKHLKFDYLKIDGEFVKALPDNATDKLVVQSVVDIARGMQARTIAEFVGDDTTVDMLRAMGVDYGQGYHLGAPGPVEGILPALWQPAA